ncbi:TIGR02569 family protein [Isoptericola variabilis]|uniref:Aminoglycoside phosphotransferase n=1 Tax=Isoptericola variabilis (strain 225) TaxID=743718 RepID=F6FRD2_ISOV2|nr:TIGR02569 family protein [Isoptericola variabilis]AEG43893.1 aminoglycoside phosphotransferase [Isoptericola variabilis 225]
MGTAPPQDVLDAFGATAEPRPLDGGRGGTWRAGEIVLKLVDLPVESEWRASILDTLPAADGFRVARPVRAVSGQWLYRGWEASRHVAGRTDPTRWGEAVDAGAAFHEAIAGEARPSFLDDRDDPWSRADRAAWDLAPLEDTPLVARVAAARTPIVVDHQLVHGDLLGNVLHEPGLPPAIIDWPPYWRPPSWAVAVAVVDAMCWHGADETLLDRWTRLDAWPQMLLRALLFRMLTDREAAGDRRQPWAPHAAYGPVARAVVRRAGAGS